MPRSFLLSAAPLAIAFVLGCSDQPNPTESGADPTASPVLGGSLAAAKATVHFTFEEPVELEFTSPCTGGLVEGTGVVVGQVNLVGDPIGGGIAVLHSEQAGTVTGTLTDQSTGATYTFRDTYHNVFNSPSGAALNFTTTSPGNMVAFPTDGSGAALILHTLIRTTVDPNGVVRVAIETVDIRCLG
jgi:hypothetical protein